MVLVLLDSLKASVEKLKGEKKTWSDLKWDHVYSRRGLCHPGVPSEEDGMWPLMGQK